MLGRRCAVSSETDSLWQSIAQDRDRWHALEATFIARVARTATDHVEGVPPGRHMLHELVGQEVEGTKWIDVRLGIRQ